MSDVLITVKRIGNSSSAIKIYTLFTYLLDKIATHRFKIITLFEKISL